VKQRPKLVILPGNVAPDRINDQVLLESLCACQGLNNEELINQARMLLSAQDICRKLSAISLQH
jgi:hypothetical protein